MKKQIKEFWVFPPGAGGNFVLTHRFNGQGEELANNEYKMTGPIRWVPMWFNKLHASHFLGIAHQITQTKYDENLEKLLSYKEDYFAWHWVPVYLKEHLSIDEIHFILPKPEDYWFVSFLTLIKNKNPSTYNQYVDDLVEPMTIENFKRDYEYQLDELSRLNTKKNYIIDYGSLFFDCNTKILERYNLTKSQVQEYTQRNIDLIDKFIKEHLDKKYQDVFLPKLGALV